MEKIEIGAFQKSLIERGKIYLLTDDIETQYGLLGFGEPLLVEKIEKDEDDNVVFTMLDSKKRKHTILRNIDKENIFYSISDEDVNKITKAENPIAKSKKYTRLSWILNDIIIFLMAATFCVYPFIFLKKISIIGGIIIFGFFILLCLILPAVNLNRGPFIANNNALVGLFKSQDNIDSLKTIKELKSNL